MMGASLTTNLRARLQIALWRHGWVWVLVTVAAAGGLALQLSLLEPTRAKLQLAQEQLQREQMRAKAPPFEAPAPAASEQQRLAALQALLRQSPGAAELVRKMAELAQAEQIRLAQSDYQHQYNSTTQLVQVQVTQPVKASYPQLRRYIKSVLRTLPNASLDQIAAKRENVGQVQVDARLKWSLWLVARPSSTPGVPASEGTP